MNPSVEHSDMQSVSHHGRKTAYRTAGADADVTLLLVHGSGATSEIWDEQFALGEQYAIVAPDCSGHGESEDVDASAGYPTLAAYGDDVLAVAEATDADVLVGNSMGGAIVMHLLIERDPEVDAAVLSGTGARLGVLEDLLRWLETDFDRAVEFFHGSGRFFQNPDHEAVEHSVRLMSECGQRITRRDMHTCHRFDERRRLPEIDVPTLVVSGAADMLTPPWFHEYLAEEIPDAELTTIDDAAQLSMIERPAAFNEALTRFLERLEIG